MPGGTPGGCRGQGGRKMLMTVLKLSYFEQVVDIFALLLRSTLRANRARDWAVLKNEFLHVLTLTQNSD